MHRAPPSRRGLRRLPANDPSRCCGSPMRSRPTRPSSPASRWRIPASLDDGIRWRAAVCGRQPALLRERGRSLDGTGAGTFSNGYTSIMTRRPVGVVAGIRVELPPDHGRPGRPGPALAAGNGVGPQARPRGPRAPRCGSPSSPRRLGLPGRARSTRSPARADVGEAPGAAHRGIAPP